jgi:hypothetical protein
MAYGRFQCLVALERFHVWWPLEGFMLGGLWKEKEKHHFHLFSLSPLIILLKHFFFPLIWRIYFTMVLNHYFMFFFPFSWPINYNPAFWCTKSFTHSSLRWLKLKIFFPFLEFMVSRITIFIGPQSTQMNEELPPWSSLDLTLTQHPRDENLKSWEVRLRLGVEPLRTWYYRIYPNFHTLMILL